MSEMLGYKALVVTKSSNSKNIKNSRDILSLPERNKPFIFRVIGQPFKFMACLEPVEPVTNSFWLKPKFDIRVVNFSGNENEVRQDAHLFYLIPIIYESEPKYLLVNYHTFNKLNRYAVSRMNNVYECEIILISSSLVYKNPPSYINEEELKEAQDALGGPELFLVKCFQEAENKCYTKYMPSIITKEIFV